MRLPFFVRLSFTFYSNYSIIPCCRENTHLVIIITSILQFEEGNYRVDICTTFEGDTNDRGIVLIRLLWSGLFNNIMCLLTNERMRSLVFDLMRKDLIEFWQPAVDIGTFTLKGFLNRP